MKQIKLLLVLLFASFFAFGQNKSLSPNIQSRIVDKDGNVTNLRFKTNAQPNLDNASIVLKDYLGASENTSFIKVKTETDIIGMQHVKYQQMFNGVLVEFGIYNVHSKNGKITSINGAFYPLSRLATTASFSKEVAANKAMKSIGAEVYLEHDDHDSHNHNHGYEGLNTQLVIFPKVNGINSKTRLVYKMDIYAEKPLYRADVYLDAMTGQVVFENNKIHHVDIAASGTSLYNGTVNFVADNTGTNYRLRQTTNGNGIETYDLNNGTNYNNATDVTSTTTSFTGSNTAVQAHWGAENTHSYFLNKHARNSYNGSGAVIKSYVSYSTNYVNAFWNGSVMTYGDGNGTTYGPLVPLDIVGHEIAHGVTSNSANLIYNAESGALNESFSDIFGEMVELYAQSTNDWMMGTDIGIGQSGAFRSMSDPKSKGDPDTYLGQYWHTSSSDNYGVHTNSGVQNKWFYILSLGEIGTNDNSDSYNVTGLGVDKAGEIAYRNLTVYLGPNSNYADARVGAIQSAIDLFGAASPEVIATTDAWYAVGVGAAYGPPPPPAPCVDGNVTLTILLDNYPAETSWDVKDNSNNIVASGGNYTTQGATITATVTLTPGAYTFTIYDSYGDGICCAYGTGNYNLSSDTLIASGGAFGSSEVTSFCVDSVANAPDTIAPTIPTTLSSSNTTQTTTDLNWTASTDNVGVTGYNVYQNGILIGTSVNTSFSVVGLISNTTYDFTVDAFDASNNTSGLSNVETVTTLVPFVDTIPPSVPLNLQHSNIAQTTLDLNWSASTDNVGVTQYTIYQFGNVIGTSTTTTFNVTGLSPNTFYKFKVSAQDAANNSSAKSHRKKAITLPVAVDNIPPTNPSNLSSSNTTQTTTDLSWSASTDNVAVAGYNVYQNNVLLGTSGNATYSVTGLQPSTTYNYTVEAFDASNNISGLSNVESVTTLAYSSTTTLHQGFFESGWDGWQDGGSDCYRYSGTRSYEGNYSIRIRDNSGTGSAMTSQSFDLTPYNSVEVEFYFYPNSMENNEDFWLRYFDGTAWSTIASYASGTDFNNNTFYVANVTLPSTQLNFATNSSFRFQCDASGNGDQIYIDAVTIKGIVGSSNVVNQMSALGYGGIVEGKIINQVDGVYPNPVNDVLQLSGMDAGYGYKIMDISGKIIKEGKLTNNLSIDVSDVSSGIYFIGIADEEEVEYHKFIKR